MSFYFPRYVSRIEHFNRQVFYVFVKHIDIYATFFPKLLYNFVSHKNLNLCRLYKMILYKDIICLKNDLIDFIFHFFYYYYIFRN